MRKIIYPLLFIITTLISSCATSKKTTSTTNWKSTAKMDEIEIFVDTESIQRKGTMIEAREKKVFYSESSKKEYVNKIRAQYAALGKVEKADKWNDFSYCIYTAEYDCLNSQFRILSIEDYDSKGGRIIRTTPSKKQERWLHVDKETVGDYTFFFVCDYEN